MAQLSWHSKASKELGCPELDGRNSDGHDSCGTTGVRVAAVAHRWAQLEGEAEVRKMALNVGRRPSWGEGADVTVEAHVMHAYGADFYGRHLRVLVSGFLRSDF